MIDAPFGEIKAMGYTIQVVPCKDFLKLFKKRTKRGKNGLAAVVKGQKRTGGGINSEVAVEIPLCISCKMGGKDDSDECAFQREHRLHLSLAPVLCSSPVPDLRSISPDNQLVFGHFINIEEPVYPRSFTRTLHQPITQEARVALLVCFINIQSPAVQACDLACNMQRAIAPALLPALRSELIHVQKYRNTLLNRSRDLKVREICGAAASSLVNPLSYVTDPWYCFQMGAECHCLVPVGSVRIVGRICAHNVSPNLGMRYFHTTSC